jgi:hypothetical protein
MRRNHRGDHLVLRAGTRSSITLRLADSAAASVPRVRSPRACQRTQVVDESHRIGDHLVSACSPISQASAARPAAGYAGAVLNSSVILPR